MGLTDKEKKLLQAFGKRVRALREEKGFTLEELEERGWASWRHFQKIERGKNINFTSLLRIAKVLDVPVEQLVKGLI